MTTKVYLSTLGTVVAPDDAKISVFDRGFLYGDSVYETMRTAGGGRPVELDRHLLRLRCSAEGIGLEVPFSPEELAQAVERTHRATGNQESYVRLMVTRGAGPIALDPRRCTAPTLVVLAQTLALPAAEHYQNGLKVVIVDVKKGDGGLDPGIKTGNYLSNIIALRQAIERGGDDAILCNAAGNVAEGATSNVFMVTGGEVVTPDLHSGLLAGITRQLVCELAGEIGCPPTQRAITPEQLRGAQELLLTSSVRGIMPVTSIDGRPVGQGIVGPVTKRLMKRYAQYLANYGS